MLQFDQGTARLLDDAYQGSDVAKRRVAILDALAPLPAERILDIGCGPGLLTLELARAVGGNGEVIGLEPSIDMRERAGLRCGERANVRLIDGRANALPLEDGSVDKAVAVQVFEYLDDIPGALAEARRVLRPGGRLVIGDNHWDSLVWHSDDGPRMARVIAAWDGHLVERAVPAFLPHLLRRAGFLVERTTPLTCCDTVLRPDGVANLLLHLIEAHASQTGSPDLDEVKDWAAEQRRLAAEGRFFFAVTHFVVAARRG
jgi:arsenite methyltransferase